MRKDSAALKPQRSDQRDNRELYSGLIRLHVLHQAVRKPIFGLRIIEELSRYGYKLSAGTLYPILCGTARSSGRCIVQPLKGGLPSDRRK